MENKDAKIRLDGIELISCSINQRPLNGFEGSDFTFNIQSDNRVEPERRLIVSFFKAEITEAQKDFVLASFTIAVGIEVLDFDDFIKKDDNGGYVIPDKLDVIVKTISISTARGIMFSSLKGTYLHNANLPIIFAMPKEK